LTEEQIIRNFIQKGALTINIAFIW